MNTSSNIVFQYILPRQAIIQILTCVGQLATTGRICWPPLAEYVNSATDGRIWSATTGQIYNIGDYWPNLVGHHWPNMRIRPLLAESGRPPLVKYEISATTGRIWSATTGQICNIGYYWLNMFGHHWQTMQYRPLLAEYVRPPLVEYMNPATIGRICWSPLAGYNLDISMWAECAEHQHQHVTRPM